MPIGQMIILSVFAFVVFILFYSIIGVFVLCGFESWMQKYSSQERIKFTIWVWPIILIGYWVLSVFWFIRRSLDLNYNCFYLLSDCWKGFKAEFFK